MQWDGTNVNQIDWTSWENEEDNVGLNEWKEEKMEQRQFEM